MIQPSVLTQNVRLLVAAASLAFAALGCAGGGSSPAPCDVPGLFTAKTCSLPGTCHGGAAPAANFDMSVAGWETMLVGKVAPGGGPAGQPTLASLCADGMRMYLKPAVVPATGLF